MSLPDDRRESEANAEIARLKRRLERERNARHESEHIAEKGLRELYDKQQQLELLGKIAVAANRTSSLADILELAISSICDFTGWAVGHALVRDQAKGVAALTSAGIWHAADMAPLQTFERLSEAGNFNTGSGLPGRVLATGAAQWVCDLRADDTFLRQEAAAAAGMAAAFAFPVLVGGEVVAVLEFFSEHVAEPNEPLLQLMSQIGVQMGRVVERKRAADQEIAGQSVRFELDRLLLIDQAEARLHEQNARLDAALANMPHGLCMFDAEKRLLLANASYAAMYNLPPDLVSPGTRLEDIVAHRRRIGNAPLNFPNYASHAGIEFKEEGNSLFEFSLADGRTIRINHLALKGGGYVATHEDITEAVRAETRINHLARHDALTGLPNRVSLREKLRDALSVLPPAKSVAVLCLDLDQFRTVNDTFGQPVGDALLAAVADRLRRCIDAGDTLASLGGDDFAVVQSGPEQPAAATELARKIISALARPYDIDGNAVMAGASIGIALAPQDGAEPNRLLKNADLALHRAKRDGRGAPAFFEPKMDALVQTRRRLDVGLRRALTHDELELHYQPLIDLSDSSITGFEALVRWRDPASGLVPPAEFIPFAEETGLIVPVGEWVLRKACAEAATWPKGLRVSVNLSARQFRGDDLVDVVFSALAASQLLPSRLELEITESVLLTDSASTLAVLHRLRDFGVRISMDDFGTGYSSLSYLRSFPFDKIKIDQSFVSDLNSGDDSVAIIRAVVGLGAALHMTITAEGVESVEQMEFLRREGCHEAQGYLFSKPRPGAELTEFFRDQKSSNWARSAA